MSSDAQLIPLSTALQISASKTGDALKDFAASHSPARLDLAELTAQLAEIGTRGRWFVENGGPFDDGREVLPGDLFGCLKQVIRNATVLVDEVCGVVREEEGEKTSATWCEHVVERLQPVARIAESIAMTMKLGVGVLEL